MFADIILPLNLPQLLTYGVPVEMQGLLQPGMRVEVALGKNKQYSGIVERLHDFKPEAYQVKPIKSIIDEIPIVNEQQLRFWRWVSAYYIAAPGEVMQAALPAHLKLMAETRLQWIADENRVFSWSGPANMVVDVLLLKKEITISEMRAIVGARHFAAVLNELLEQEAISINDSLEPTYKTRKEKLVLLAETYHEEPNLIELFNQLQRAPKQLELLMAHTELSIKNSGIVRQADLIERTAASAAQVKALVDKGVFIIQEKDIDRIPARLNQNERQVVFTPAQQVAYNELNKGIQEKSVTLLHGVTGSGKTLLYIRKINECIAAGKQAIFLLPEIALTTQLVGRLLAYFGESLGVYHSHFSNNERVEIWEKVRKGTYKIVVGPRSALWLPYNDLGIIIVDEEHDGSYKQRDPAPRFHARDAAIYLASLFDAKVILGSATPSLESLYNVQQGKYGYASLKDRYLGVKMPVIEVINAKSLEGGKKGNKLLTPELQAGITEALQTRKQVILFQNRRGYAPFQICTVCGWVPQCKNCAVSLTYHKSTDKMHCHYCGIKSAVTSSCPSCGSSSLISKSFGTEKIEEEVRLVFPDARIARMDVDSMRSKNSMATLLEQLDKNKIDILVGTQMVVKGLDFASVSLVGILSADSLLSFPDFRVNERAFQLMEQVSGRAGRADGLGKVLIQSYNTQHPVLQWVKDHDVAAFYRNEIRYREHFSYPPFSRLIKVVFKHENEAKTFTAANHFAEALKDYSSSRLNNEKMQIIVQGPGPAIISRVRNQYIQEIWIKCPRDNKALDTIKTWLKAQKQHTLAIRNHGNVQVVFDVDPA